jgi:hypothetical protein
MTFFITGVCDCRVGRISHHSIFLSFPKMYELFMSLVGCGYSREAGICEVCQGAIAVHDETKIFPKT